MSAEADETRDLRRAVRGFLEQHASVRAQLTDDPAICRRLSTELGLMGLAVAEEHGGSGASFVELAAVLEEAGRTLLRAPLLSTAVAAAVLQHAGATDLLPGLTDGSNTAALAFDGGLVVVDERLTGSAPVIDATADCLLLVIAGDGLFVCTPTTVTSLQALDPTRPQSLVTLDDVPGRRVGDSADAGHAVDLLLVALAAECVGGARRALEMAVEHLKVREQFGRPLGSFQALRHRVADLTVELEAASSTAWYAARAAAERSPDLPVVAPLAKAAAADAFTHIAGECIQLHGGIGFTWEHDAHLFFKRAWTTALLHGDSRALRRTAFARSGC